MKPKNKWKRLLIRQKAYDNLDVKKGYVRPGSLKK